ncbi:hypothetical protein [Nocardia sp. NPDC005745]|uniref:tyrosine-type recombinase/integrase n=1 Tax=Nocardia sp. NPDC005745 TaxID=3157061 RepID=UPI0033FAE4E9
MYPAAVSAASSASRLAGAPGSVQHRRRAARRANSRGGHGAEANFISALRFLYQNAETDGLIQPDANPAVEARKTSQASGKARALSLDQIADLGRVASTTGDDPELDALILRLHIETACRRSSVLALDIEDLERDDCLVRLHERGGAIRWQPISPTLMSRLLDHVRNRGGRNVTERVLRYHDGTPVALARYQYLVRRFRDELPWAEELQVNMDWIGHTTEEFVKTDSAARLRPCSSADTHASTVSKFTIGTILGDWPPWPRCWSRSPASPTLSPACSDRRLCSPPAGGLPAPHLRDPRVSRASRETDADEQDVEVFAHARAPFASRARKRRSNSVTTR